jgi:hypothetical protein
VSALDENPNCAGTHATFRLVGDALDPDEVHAALGISPTQAFVKGQEVPLDRTGDATRRQPTGVWLLASRDRVESNSLERHLIHLLDAIEPAATPLERLRDRHQLRADFFCFWASATGHGGPELTPGTLARIAALDATLGIDFYQERGRA